MDGRRVFAEVQRALPWRAVAFEYSRSAQHEAFVLPLETDFMANRTATKEAAGPQSLKGLEENEGGREKGGGGGGRKRGGCNQTRKKK